MIEIQLYTKSNCPLCEETKELLKTNEISYSEIVIGTDISREEVLTLFPNAKIAPVIVVEGAMILKEFLPLVINIIKIQKQKGNIDA